MKTFWALFAGAVLLLVAHDAQARRGYVRTRAGVVLEGHLRFESNVVVIVDAEKRLREEVSLTNLVALGFDSEVEVEDSLAEPSVNVPYPWQQIDVGSVDRAGEAEFRRGVFRVRGTGTNVLGEGDSFHFIQKAVGDESEMVARVLRVRSDDPWARAGLMMRDGLGADAKHVFLAITAARGGSLTSRERRGGDTTVALDAGLRGSQWIKLKRDGARFTALASPDGRRWRVIERLTMPMEEVHAGLAVVGGREGTVGEAMFDSVEEGASLRNRNYPPQVELKSGTMQSGYIARLDDTAVYFDTRPPRQPLSVRGVALVRFQPVPPKLAPLVSQGAHGVLLTSGEFIEGECNGVANDRVTVSSVPLGLKRYDVNNEVIALVFGKRATLPGAFEVRTTDGATWQARAVSLDREGLMLQEPALGTRRIYLHEIVELRRVS